MTSNTTLPPWALAKAIRSGRNVHSDFPPFGHDSGERYQIKYGCGLKVPGPIVNPGKGAHRISPPKGFCNPGGKCVSHVTGSRDRSAKMYGRSRASTCAGARLLNFSPR